MGFPDGYDAVCRRDGASWSVRVPAVGAGLPARRLAEAELVAADLVAAATGRPRDDIRIRLRLDVPAELRPLIDEAAAACREADHMSPAAITRRRALARKLVAEDFAMADVAWLLGVSVPRAHQLAGRKRVTTGHARGARGAREARRPGTRAASRRPRTAGTPGVVPPAAHAPARADAADGDAQPGLASTHSGYQHEAFLYRGEDEFLAGTVPFVRDGVEQGQAVMVAVVEPRLKLLREALGEEAEAVEFVDMARLGANPARIIPRWRRFIDDNGGARQPIRGVGEPIWAGRRPQELLECQLHEALLNVAVHPDTPLWLSCPYDAGALGEDVLAEAHRSHPTLVEDSKGYRGSTTYGGLHHVDEMFRSPLPEPSETPDRLRFGQDDVPDVRWLVVRRAAEAGLSPSRQRALAVAVTEFAAHSVAHGGGEGVLRVWQEADALVCEVSDRGYLDDPLVGRLDPDDGDDADRAVWLANEVCDLTQVRSTGDGTTFRALSWL
jgi:hypothetical protein